MEKVKEQIQQIQEVNYRNISMTACVKKDGTIYVNIKNICDGLGIDYSSQLKRINRDDMLPQGVVKMTIPSSGGEQETNMMLITFLPFFLTGIKTSMVKPEIAKNLFDFKLKAKDVLAAAFLPPQYQPQSSTLLLEQSITSLQASQQNMIDCAMEQGYQLASHEEQLESIQRCLQYDLLHADKMDEISSEFSRLEEEIAELKNGISCKQVETTQETRKSVNRPATAAEIAKVIVQPLIEKFDDHSSGGCATYRKVYEAMGVSWKYRTTKYMNEHELKVVPKKLEMIVNDRKLRTLFTKAIEKLLQEN